MRNFSHRICDANCSRFSVYETVFAFSVRYWQNNTYVLNRGRWGNTALWGTPSTRAAEIFKVLEQQLTAFPLRGRTLVAGKERRRYLFDIFEVILCFLF